MIILRWLIVLYDVGNGTGVIKVISFNIKRDFGFSFSQKNSWEKRRSIVAEMIKSSGASIVGVQELLPSMRSDVEHLLANDYTILGFGRFHGQKPKDDEHTDIIVRNNDVDIKFYKTFWLSRNPEEEASRALSAVFPRICTVAEVYIKDIDQKIRVFNTHFDHISGFARNLGVRIILDYINKFNEVDPLPCILMGDLNAGINTRAVRILRENLHSYKTFHLNDVYQHCTPDTISNTLHFFSGKIKPGRSPIDYIFVSDDFEVLESHIDTKDFEGQYPSDHYPIIATLRIKKSICKKAAE